MDIHRLLPNSILIAVSIILVLSLLDDTWALKCRTEDGPSSDEIRKVIRVCMKRISSESENKSSNEYENYDSSYLNSDSDEDRETSTDGNVRRQVSGGGQMENTKRNGEQMGMGRDSSRNNDDRRGNGKNRQDNGRRNDRDQEYDYGPSRRRMDDGRNQYGRYKRQYYNDGSQGGYGYSAQQNERYNRDRDNFMQPSSNSSGNGTSNTERDRACMMQCFFQEMKMTNNEGFPDKHKVLHVVTKDLRDFDLRDFYTDSIQECFHMISMDNKLKDKCDYSMKFVMCLADRGQANCNDWDNETIMF
ncbi:general odorant-binding protein 71-like [Armigeres subalbatus]|uniref:general odorant-binding protein 71-like n=1 Tax=Armigeres subalbatus TaxID=124917 RepID=UPI002ED4AF05